ncbi:hypothetical protein jhhlp_007129 [Lomentospora prolificans]|uniref:RING-type E3 ubiquitin transferase n=1 Tax=Lomentospora prolificans TaxID=41688 RepID=A0A2N3N1T4_9PEZI|nr:hypothetical protein jhhlp_007129 [Lomentospora prolificans]
MSSSPDEGNSRLASPPAGIDHAGSRLSSSSGSSYIGSDAPTMPNFNCPWRTSEFHEDECSRYFDCPTHLVERRLSDPESSSEPADSPALAQENASHADGDGRDFYGEANPSPAYPVLEQGHGTGSTSSSEQLGEEASSPGEDDSTAPVPPPRDEGYFPSISQVPTASTQSLDIPIRTASLPRSTSRSSQTSDLTQRRLPSPPLPSPPLPPIPQDTRPSMLELPSASYNRNETTVSTASSRGPNYREPPETVLPRWQPDSDVTICPICRTQFSFFVRKHHCRKCGRVVCNACSPHRIVIPYQYIVRPPTQARISQLYLGDDGIGYSDGGERVRLCNPCVPDPNTNPPSALTSPNQNSPRPHHRSQSSVSGGFGAFPPVQSPGLFPSNTLNDPYARGRSVTMNFPATAGSRRPFAPTENQILAGTPPLYYPASASSSQYPSSRIRYRSARESAGSSSSTQRALPPTPQIAEEDECPVCHRELPSRTLPNFEALRESHITSCITSHSAYGGGGGGAGGGSSPSDGATPSSPRSVRRTGMFPYLATEKDCVDSAECTICLEEFEVGVPMARLECLCRFHRRCISAWFVNHPGRCPVHQHDSYGY